VKQSYTFPFKETDTESIGVMSRGTALQPVISPSAISMNPALLLNVLFSMKKISRVAGTSKRVSGLSIRGIPSLYDSIGPNM